MTGSSRIAASFAALLLCSGTVASHSHAQQTSNVTPPTLANSDLDAVFAAQPCNTGKVGILLDAPIARLSKRLAANEPAKIIAIGSSSTAGSGASSAAFSYPTRLSQELQRKFPHASLSVVNAGINGEEASDMLARLNGVLQTNPDLVIWQVGTNAVMRDHDASAVADVLHAGITLIKNSGADVMLIDPQFAPAVNKKSKIMDMVGMIGIVAKRTHVAVFNRYHAMRHWNEDQSIAFDRFITPDGLHMNDWGYSCFARLLADNIARTITRSRAVADAKPAL